MNILTANWTWYPSGGDWTYIAQLRRLLESKGHAVIPFSMADDRNEATAYAKYFVDHINYRELNKRKTIANGVKVLRRAIYSKDAAQRLSRLLDQVPIDVAHLHNIHHYLTPSIIRELKRRDIPVYWTLHDYSLLCPESSFVSNGEICERCRHGRFYMCAVRRCKKRSFLASAVASVENQLHSLLGLREAVDGFLCPSTFLRDKFEEHGYPPEKLHQVYNCYYDEFPDPAAHRVSVSDEPYLAYVGRLEPIKGIATLLEACRMERDVPLVLVGHGTLEDQVLAALRTGDLPRVRFLGRKTPDEVRSILAGSIATVCPSEWYENFPYSVVQPMAAGKPVIGARVGGIPELVIPMETGFLIERRDARGLAEKMRQLWESPELARRLGAQAREHVRRLTDPEQHYDRIRQIFSIP